MEKIKNIKIKYLNNYEYVSSPPESLNLDDIVVSFYNGKQWINVKLDIMLSYSIFYTKYYNEDNKKIDITLVVCTLTLRTTIFEGLYKFKTYIDNRMILVDDTNSLIPIDIGYKIDNQKEIYPNKRMSVKICTLRNSILDNPDCIYLITNMKLKYVIQIENYYKTNLINNITNIKLKKKYHPKTLVYLIQYKGKKKINTSIIIGNDVKKNTITGYDIKLSKFDDYLKKYHEKIIEKEGYLIPILLGYAILMYPESESKYIYL